MLNRRALLAASLAAPSLITARRAYSETTTVRMGALKLIHSIAPYFYQQFAPDGLQIDVVPFESPTDCKNAVVTKSVDFGTFGIAAGILGLRPTSLSSWWPPPATVGWLSWSRKTATSTR